MSVQQTSEYLRNLGIRPGDVLLIHASFNSMRSFSGTPARFIEHVLDYLTPDGTLCIPALSYEFVNEMNPCFHLTKTKSCIGIIPETFRNMLHVLRSMHPTHSVCAKGKLAVEITGEHYRDATPCGPNSPFRLLPELGGKILMLGCGLKPNTSMHAIEELHQPEYLYGPPLEFTLIDEMNQICSKHYSPHNFKGWIQRYDKVLDLKSAEWIVQGKMYGADCFSFASKTLFERVSKQMQLDSLYFVDKKVK